MKRLEGIDSIESKINSINKYSMKVNIYAIQIAFNKIVALLHGYKNSLELIVESDDNSPFIYLHMIVEPKKSLYGIENVHGSFPIILTKIRNYFEQKSCIPSPEDRQQVFATVGLKTVAYSHGGLVKLKITETHKICLSLFIPKFFSF